MGSPQRPWSVASPGQRGRGGWHGEAHGVPRSGAALQMVLGRGLVLAQGTAGDVSPPLTPTYLMGCHWSRAGPWCDAGGKCGIFSLGLS